MLHIIDGEVAGDGNQDGITERRGLAERMAGDLRNDLVHGTGFPRKRTRSSRALRQHQVDDGQK